MKNNYNSLLIKELERFRNLVADSKLFDRFTEKLTSTDKLNKEVNIDEHLCAFFVPVNKKSKSVYLGHHIKADDWIPPGGHIKLGEHPLVTVIREFKEELNHTISKRRIKPFALSVKDVSANPRNPCKIHYDLWYYIEVPRKRFKYLKKEFYDAYWHVLNEDTFSKIETPQYNRIVRELKQIM